MTFLSFSAKQLVWLLLLLQVHRVLLCTFEVVSGEVQNVYAKGMWTSQSRGDCLKMCVEDFHDCIVAGIRENATKYDCIIYYHHDFNRDEVNYGHDPSITLYRLKKGEDRLECPLAEKVLPLASP
ncbi:hypothetical protein V3C99_006754 [Haemonchus contortus]